MNHKVFYKRKNGKKTECKFSMRFVKQMSRMENEAFLLIYKV